MISLVFCDVSHFHQIVYLTCGNKTKRINEVSIKLPIEFCGNSCYIGYMTLWRAHFVVALFGIAHFGVDVLAQSYEHNFFLLFSFSNFSIF